MIGFLGPIPAAQEEDFKATGLEPNRDKVGYAGLELQYQDLLAGVNGRRTVEVDVAGKELRTLGEPVDPRAGQNMRLTIDTRLQQAATAIMEREINYWNTYLQRNPLDQRRGHRHESQDRRDPGDGFLSHL